MKLRTAHLLATLSEECAEVIQAVCKIQRFGEAGVFEGEPTNVDRLAAEIGEVLAVVEMLVEQGLLPEMPSTYWATLMAVKKGKVEAYMPEEVRVETQQT